MVLSVLLLVLFYFYFVFMESYILNGDDYKSKYQSSLIFFLPYRYFAHIFFVETLKKKVLPERKKPYNRTPVGGFLFCFCFSFFFLNWKKGNGKSGRGEGRETSPRG